MATSIVNARSIPTPGWMYSIVKDLSQEVYYRRLFNNEGEIREVEYKYTYQINGWKCIILKRLLFAMKHFKSDEAIVRQKRTPFLVQLPAFTQAYC